MDPSLGFAQLLGIAQQQQQSKSNVKLFSTKVSSAKKETKTTKKLSENVQKFLDKKEREEKQKKIEDKLNAKKLVQNRTEKQKRKIHIHLKHTKSSNKAEQVLEEAVDNKDTVDTIAGRAQCDEDDYGYESKISNSIYEKLMNKFEANPDDPMAKFSKAAPKQAKDISSTMDRVRNALKREEEEKLGPRRRKRKAKYAADDGFINDVDSPTRKKEKSWLDDCDEKSAQKYKDDSSRHRDDRDNKYSSDRNSTHDPNKEKEDRERREKDKREREKEREKDAARKRRLELAKKAPPPMDFQALLKAAADKKDKPIVKKKKEDVKDQEFGGRPMTEEQKHEFRKEEERRLRREGKLPPKPKEPQGRIPKNSDGRIPKNTEGRIPKNASATSRPPSKPEPSRKPEPTPAPKPHIPKKPPPPVKKAEPGPQFHHAVKKTMSFKNEFHKQKQETSKPAYKPPAHYKSDWKGEDLTGGKRDWGKEERKPRPDNGRGFKSAEKPSDRDRERDRDDSYDRRKEDRRDDSRGRKDDRRDEPRGRKDDRRDDSYSRKENYRSSDSKKIAKPEKSKKDIDWQRGGQINGVKKDDGKRRFDPSKMGKLPAAFKRRIESDSDSEYDSELDDFIDDTEEKVDIGAEIRSIFGYDKRRFRDEADFDDRSMENNKFSHIMMEEAKSAKIGRMEDMADIRREEEEKKRKMKKNKR